MIMHTDGINLCVYVTNQPFGLSLSASFQSSQINKLIGTMIVKDMNNLTISAKYTHIVVRLCTQTELIYACLSLTSLSA